MIDTFIETSEIMLGLVALYLIVEWLWSRLRCHIGLHLWSYAGGGEFVCRDCGKVQGNTVKRPTTIDQIFRRAIRELKEEKTSSCQKPPPRPPRR
jgi:hypothetical protein